MEPKANVTHHMVYDVLVVSPGGMGCTYVHQQLERCAPELRKNSKHDADMLKHCPSPWDMRARLCHYSKALYVWNDPLLALMSIYRRGYQVMQHRKIHDREDQWLPPADVATLGALVARTCDPEDDPLDWFGFEEHLCNWMGYPDACLPTGHEILAIDIRDAAAGDMVSQFLGTPVTLEPKGRRDYTDQIRALPPEFIRVYDDVNRHAQRLITTQTGRLVEAGIL